MRRLPELVPHALPHQVGTYALDDATCDRSNKSCRARDLVISRVLARCIAVGTREKRDPSRRVHPRVYRACIGCRSCKRDGFERLLVARCSDVVLLLPLTRMLHRRLTTSLSCIYLSCRSKSGTSSAPRPSSQASPARSRETNRAHGSASRRSVQVARSSHDSKVMR